MPDRLAGRRMDPTRIAQLAERALDESRYWYAAAHPPFGSALRFGWLELLLLELLAIWLWRLGR